MTIVSNREHLIHYYSITVNYYSTSIASKGKFELPKYWV